MAKTDPLDRKRRRVERYRFEVEDPTDAQAELIDAGLAKLRARTDEELAAAAERVKAAKAAVEECFSTIRLRALDPDTQLAFQHEQAAAAIEREQQHAAAVDAAEEAGEAPPPAPTPPDPDWSAESFEVRLIAACDLDGRTAKRWAAALASPEWTLQDKTELLDTAFRSNSPRTAFDLSLLGKG